MTAQSTHAGPHQRIHAQIAKVAGAHKRLRESHAEAAQHAEKARADALASLPAPRTTARG
jgi:hypothetical protein